MLRKVKFATLAALVKVDEKNRVCVARLEWCPRLKAIARCNPADKFRPYLGATLAAYRAFQQTTCAALLQAEQNVRILQKQKEQIRKKLDALKEASRESH